MTGSILDLRNKPLVLADPLFPSLQLRSACTISMTLVLVAIAPTILLEKQLQGMHVGF
jgi:hypothetical protein